MEDKYDWCSIGIFIAKEEVIVLRTLYLEFGNARTKKVRLELPYENIEISDSDGSEGYHAIDLYGMLSFYYPISDKFPRPLDFEFLEYDHFFTNDASCYGIPWKSAVFNFVEDIKPDKLKSKLNFRFKMTLIWLKELANKTSVTCDPRVIEYLERPDDIIYLESLEDYKKLSNNNLFNNLRIGLWYKKFGDYKMALKFLKKAREHCIGKLIKFQIHNLDYIGEFNKKMEQYEKEIDIDVMDIMSDSCEYSDWWESNSKLIKIPIALQLSGEETPSFQMGEIYLKQGEKYLKEKDYRKAKNNYIKANRYFQEVENYLFLWYRKNRHLKYNSQTIDDEFKAKKPGKEKRGEELTEKQIKIILEVTLKTPNYLPLSIKPFQRNPYLERNLQICKSRLELIKSKKISKEDSIKDQKAKDLENMEDKELMKIAEKLITKMGQEKKTPLNNNIKKINKNSIEDNCKKKFPIIYPKLCWESKNEMIRDIIYKKITISEKIFDFRTSIGCLSTMFEREAGITITELIKKHRLNFHFKSTDYKISKLKNLLEEFGQEKLKINKREIYIVINDLNRASYFRTPFAHPTRGGTHDELLEFRKLLFGSDREEDGLLYKIIKYRSI
jgi:tetratricopeptide (TPR) repeat protein